MSYSNRFFLRRRTKELGVYALLGYRKTTVLSLLTTENLLVCFGAFIVGILLGSFFHKGIVFGITKLLDLSINNSKYPFQCQCHFKNSLLYFCYRDCIDAV